jgi:hypothetical protein
MIDQVSAAIASAPKKPWLRDRFVNPATNPPAVPSN